MNQFLRSNGTWWRGDAESIHISDLPTQVHWSERREEFRSKPRELVITEDRVTTQAPRLLSIVIAAERAESRIKSKWSMRTSGFQTIADDDTASA